MLGDKSKVMTKSQVMLRALRKIKQGRETRAQTAWPGVIWLRSQGRDRDNQVSMLEEHSRLRDWLVQILVAN